jgi:predicted tellurium resistance membrane protein TerC
MDTFTVQSFIDLGLLILLQAVLGFDNLLYISLESKRAPAGQQKKVRTWGIGLAVVLRIGLLFLLISVIGYFQDPMFGINIPGVIGSEFNLHSLIVLAGGGFILYTSMKEIWHMIALEEHEEQRDKKPKSVAQVITMIILMNLVFSFDSILGAIALTDVFWVMATAIVIGGVLMIWLADRVATFLEKNRLYEVLGLFVLFLVGVMLLSEGGHLAHLVLFENEILPMSKANFYFIIVILILIDLVQGRYQRKLMAAKARQRAKLKAVSGSEE